MRASQVDGEPGRLAGARRAPRPGRERGGSAAPLGAAPGEPATRPHPSKLERDSLGLPEGSGRAAGGRVSGRATRGTSPWVGAPFQGPAPGGTRTGSRAGPGPLDLAASPRRPPVQCPHRAGSRGAEKGSAGPGGASPEGSAPAGCAPAEGDSGVGIRRKGSARRKGWTLEAAERQKRLQGTGGAGGGVLGRRGCGIKKALGCGPRERRCAWAQRGCGSLDTWIF